MCCAFALRMSNEPLLLSRRVADRQARYYFVFTAAANRQYHVVTVGQTVGIADHMQNQRTEETATISEQKDWRDCFTCRASGTVTLAGVSAWLLYQRSQVERSAVGHRRLLAGMSLGFLAASVVRWNV